MWHGWNPNDLPELVHLRTMIALQRQSPTKEWQLHHEEEDAALLVVREWPDGSITAYTLSTRDDGTSVDRDRL